MQLDQLAQRLASNEAARARPSGRPTSTAGGQSAIHTATIAATRVLQQAAKPPPASPGKWKEPEAANHTSGRESATTPQVWEAEEIWDLSWLTGGMHCNLVLHVWLGCTPDKA